MEINSNTIEIVSFVALLGGQWALIQYRINRNEKDAEKEMANVWSEISKIRAWCTTHEKESNEARLGIEKQFGAMALTVNDTTSKFESIMEHLEEIKKRIADFDGRKPYDGR